ncbi:TMV resistance protein N-like isoform X1 [Rosa chinensis]|uniref:TMV resistance protein N-like isoform X1 n=1 Tax=Rosa chinensis TaxID=74649 RepID=UPI000D095F38|nr:TMV resistance protein N-like isoform X1 [Rosa chinensis]
MALSTQVRASTGSAFPWKYDVFLSFRGEDTRKGFTDHLYDKLQWRGITTFRDDPELEKGTAISSELLSAIEQSRFAVVVLSPNYASSTWCLLELSKIFECMEERGTILPIFYEVEPSHVRHQRGSFAEAFDEHEEKLGEGNKEVEGWRDALTKVANLAGWTSKNYRYETELIREIVQALWSKVHPSLTVFGSSEKLVGMDTKLEEIDVLLDKEANDVRFIGVWGMGGLGKTTLARLVYEQISDQFEVCIFLANVREVSATHGLVYLQKQILSQILKEENVQVWDVYSGITMTKRCLCNKVVLLVLDDVDQVEQLETLVGEKDWFGLRSRIIITTRNRHILVTHGIEKPYELKGLNDDEALQLFSWKAFRKYEPEEDYAEHSKSFVMYAGGLPLALKTLGSFLYKRSPHAWSSTLQKLQQIPNTTVFEILKISYDGLDEMEKKVFLDIACFHRLYYNEFMIEQVYSSDFCIRIAIDVLVEKSLLTIVVEKDIDIHELIEEMGHEIVRRECCEEPGGRSRLWLRKDIFHVFMKNTGTEVIEGIFLHLEELEEADWNLEAFSKMCKLKLLYIHNLRLSLGPKCLPNALRFLKWSWYPSKSLPPGFQPDDLTELSLVHSNIDHLWNGIKYLGKLKSIDLSYSIKLTRTPDLTGIQNLEKLVFEGCTNLVDIHPSIAFLNRLKILNFRNCKSIKCFPSEVEMESLETFDVSGCSILKMIPEFVGQMKRISKLYISGTDIEKLPSSIERFSESLVELDLSGIVTRGLPYSLFLKQNLRVSSFGLFPRKSPHPLIPLLASLKHLSSLTSLNLSGCNLREGEIPNDIGSMSSLENLDLRGNNFVSLPASIHLLSKLQYINVEDCKRLQQLPDLPSNDYLSVRTDNCTSLQLFPHPQVYGRQFMYVCINCLSTVVNRDSSYFLYSMLKRLLEETPCSFYYFSFIIPGSEIFEWFSDQSLGDSVTAKLPSYSCNSSKWIGVAVCALFVPQDNPSAVPEDDELDPNTCQIFCTWDGYSSGLSAVGHSVKQIVADHLYFVVLHKRFLEPQYCLEDTCYEVKFVFQTVRAVGNNRCLQVKKCGAYALYKHHTEELISKMNQSSSSISLYMEETMDCDLDKSAYEEGGAIVKGTPEAAASTSGGCEDEYYSAEE